MSYDLLKKYYSDLQNQLNNNQLGLQNSQTQYQNQLGNIDPKHLGWDQFGNSNQLNYNCSAEHSVGSFKPTANIDIQIGNQNYNFQGIVLTPPLHLKQEVEDKTSFITRFIKPIAKVLSIISALLALAILVMTPYIILSFVMALFSAVNYWNGFHQKKMRIETDKEVKFRVEQEEFLTQANEELDIEFPALKEKSGGS